MMLPPAVPEGQGNIASDDYPTVSANSTASVSHSNFAEDVRARSSFAGKQRIRQEMLSGPILSTLGIWTGGIIYHRYRSACHFGGNIGFGHHKWRDLARSCRITSTTYR